jgi:hypothetical protein
MTPVYLTREEIFGMNDIATKDIMVPDTIPVWGGRTIKIKQLTRGQQDNYLKRQYGDTRMRQDAKAKNQEISAINIYGHDAWLCVCSICDADGKPMFKQADLDKLNERNGEAIGWIASEIVKFSGMDTEAKIARGEITSEEALKEEIKN